MFDLRARRAARGPISRRFEWQIGMTQPPATSLLRRIPRPWKDAQLDEFGQPHTRTLFWRLNRQIWGCVNGLSLDKRRKRHRTCEQACDRPRADRPPKTPKRGNKSSARQTEYHIIRVSRATRANSALRHLLQPHSRVRRHLAIGEPSCPPNPQRPRTVRRSYFAIRWGRFP